MRGLSVPRHWSRSRVKHLVRSMRAGDTITVDLIEQSGNYPVYGANGLRGFTSRRTHVGTHVLIGRQGALCGNVHLVSGEFWASEHAIVATPAPDVDERWLAALLKAMNLGQYSSSAAQPGIGVGQIAPLLVSVPPRNEQRVIADYLDHETAQIDALVSKQKEFIDLLRERRVAEITSGVEEGEPNSSFRRHVTNIRQGWSPNAEPFPADGVREWGILKVGCSTAGVFRPEENKKLPPDVEARPELVVKRGEIVMSRSNTRDLVGSAAVVLDEFPRLMLSDLNYGLTTAATLDPEFAVYALLTRRARAELTSRAKGTSPSMQKLAQRDVLDIPLWVPGIDKQRAIVECVKAQTARIDALIAKAEEHIALATERRSALITAAVTGQIDVCAARKAS
ncbi:restriction endonuclease subunit S [Nocardia puris]|uniref:restriction endonuclease subunit S n=1 Tax=Nocardia puris TaxID=208602 RepID=UPI002E1DCB22